MDKTTIPDFRSQRGEAIAQVEGAVRRVDEASYLVKSQSGKAEYRLVLGELGWICPCPDATFRGVKCKHIWGVEFSLKLRERIVNDTIIQPINPAQCPSCQSPCAVKHGVRHNHYGDIQQFLCKDCRRTFVVNLRFEKMHSTPLAITQAMQLYFSGESLRGTQKFLRLQSVKVSHVAILKWIRKYVGLMSKYLDGLEPNVSDTWRADEVYVKFKGNPKWMFAMMDDETRFWLAQQVADHKGVSDITSMLREGKAVAHKSPTTFITDAAPNFHVAYRREFAHSHPHDKRPKAVHIAEIQIDGVVHNNKQERLNGEFRDREKVMRGLKNMDSPALKGLQIYHNFVRPHMGLNGKTPAEAAGIQVKGENNWLTLIQNASLGQRAKASQTEQEWGS